MTPKNGYGTPGERPTRARHHVKNKLTAPQKPENFKRKEGVDNTWNFVQPSLSFMIMSALPHFVLCIPQIFSFIVVLLHYLKVKTQRRFIEKTSKVA